MACSKSCNSEYSTSGGKATNYEAILAISKNQGIVLDKPKSLKFVTLESRIKTFCELPLKLFGETFRVTLAKAGFVYEQGTGDLVCFHCAVVVKPDEVLNVHSPWHLHVQRFAYCAHVRHCKGDKFIIDILKGDKGDELEQLGCDTIDQVIERNKTAVIAVIENYKDEAVVRKAVEYLVGKLSKRTFTGYDLALVIEDNLVENDGANAGKDDAEEMDAENAERLIEENEQLSERWRCKICFNDDACIIILPCGHMSTCPQCIAPLQKCPMCRKPMKGTVRAMFAKINGRY